MVRVAEDQRKQSFKECMIDKVRYWIGDFGIYIICAAIVKICMSLLDNYGNKFFDGDIIVYMLTYSLLKETILKRK